MGKIRSLEEYEGMVERIGLDKVETLEEFAFGLSEILGVDETVAHQLGKRIVTCLERPLRLRKSSKYEGKEYVPCTSALLSPLLEYLVFEKGFDAEFVRRVREEQSFGIFKGRKDHRSELIFRMVHNNPDGVLDAKASAYVSGAIERYFELCAILETEPADERTVSETYRDFARSVTVTEEGMLFRDYTQDHSKTVKSMIQTLRS